MKKENLSRAQSICIELDALEHDLEIMNMSCTTVVLSARNCPRELRSARAKNMQVDQKARFISELEDRKNELIEELESL